MLQLTTCSHSQLSLPSTSPNVCIRSALKPAGGQAWVRPRDTPMASDLAIPQHITGLSYVRRQSLAGYSYSYPYGQRPSCTSAHHRIYARTQSLMSHKLFFREGMYRRLRHAILSPYANCFFYNYTTIYHNQGTTQASLPSTTSTSSRNVLAQCPYPFDSKATQNSSKCLFSFVSKISISSSTLVTLSSLSLTREYSTSVSNVRKAGKMFSTTRPVRSSCWYFFNLPFLLSSMLWGFD